MARIAFIGLGHMGGGMAPNLAKGGHEVHAFDLVPEAVEKAASGGCTAASSAGEAVKDADVVITMLPAAHHVRMVYENDVAPNAKAGALLIDCSTIDVSSAREVGAGWLRRADRGDQQRCSTPGPGGRWRGSPHRRQRLADPAVRARRAFRRRDSQSTPSTWKAYSPAS